MDAATWDRQPYWAQFIYMQGLNAEKPWLVRLTPHPDGWVNPFDEIEESFAEINLLETEDEDEQSSETEPVDTLPKELRGLPDIKSLGAKVIK